MNKKLSDIMQESELFNNLDAEVNDRINRLTKELYQQKIIREAVLKKKEEHRIFMKLSEQLEKTKSCVDSISAIYPDYEKEIKELIIEKLGIEKGSSLYNNLMLPASTEQPKTDTKTTEEKSIPTYSVVEVVDQVNAEVVPLSRKLKDTKVVKSSSSSYVIPDVEQELVKKALDDCHKYIISQLKTFLSKNYYLKYDKNNQCLNIKYIATKVGCIYGLPVIETYSGNKLSVDLSVQKLFRDEYCFNIDAFVKDVLDGQEPSLDDYTYDGNLLVWHTPDSGIVARIKGGILTMRYFKVVYDSKEPEGWNVKFSQTPSTTKWFKPSDGAKYSDNTECLVPYIRFRRKDYQLIKKRIDILSEIPNIRFYHEKDKNYYVGKIGYILQDKIRYYIYYENGVLDKDKNYHTENVNSFMWVLRSDGDILKSYDIVTFVDKCKEYFKKDTPVVDPNEVTYSDCVEILEAFNTLEELESVAGELNKMVDQLSKKEKIMFKEYYNTMYVKLRAVRY